MELREIENYIYEESFDFGDIMTGLPIKQLKEWLNSYKNLKDKPNFEEYIMEKAWMVCDNSYKDPSNYSVYYLDQNKRYFADKTTLDYNYIRKMFEPLFVKQFMIEQPDGTKLYLINQLKHWARTYVGYYFEYYNAFFDRIRMYEEPDFYEQVLAMFINGMCGVCNYFIESGTKPPTLEDAETLVASYIDCSNVRIPLGQKWGYIAQSSNGLRSYMIRRILYEMMLETDKKSDKNIRELVRLKDKKLKLDLLKSRLSPEEQLKFCITWQKITGQ